MAGYTPISTLAPHLETRVSDEESTFLTNVASSIFGSSSLSADDDDTGDDNLDFDAVPSEGDATLTTHSSRGTSSGDDSSLSFDAEEGTILEETGTAASSLTTDGGTSNAGRTPEECESAGLLASESSFSSSSSGGGYDDEDYYHNSNRDGGRTAAGSMTCSSTTTSASALSSPEAESSSSSLSLSLSLSASTSSELTVSTGCRLAERTKERSAAGGTSAAADRQRPTPLRRLKLIPLLEMPPPPPPPPSLLALGGGGRRRPLHRPHRSGSAPMPLRAPAPASSKKKKKGGNKVKAAAANGGRREKGPTSDAATATTDNFALLRDEIESVRTENSSLRRTMDGLMASVEESLAASGRAMMLVGQDMGGGREVSNSAGRRDDAPSSSSHSSHSSRSSSSLSADDCDDYCDDDGYSGALPREKRADALKLSVRRHLDRCRDSLRRVRFNSAKERTRLRRENQRLREEMRSLRERAEARVEGIPETKKGMPVGDSTRADAEADAEAKDATEADAEAAVTTRTETETNRTVHNEGEGDDSGREESEVGDKESEEEEVGEGAKVVTEEDKRDCLQWSSVMKDTDIPLSRCVGGSTVTGETGVFLERTDKETEYAASEDRKSLMTAKGVAGEGLRKEEDIFGSGGGIGGGAAAKPASVANDDDSGADVSDISWKTNRKRDEGVSPKGRHCKEVALSCSDVSAATDRTETTEETDDSGVGVSGDNGEGNGTARPCGSSAEDGSNVLPLEDARGREWNTPPSSALAAFGCNDDGAVNDEDAIPFDEREAYGAAPLLATGWRLGAAKTGHDFKVTNEDAAQEDNGSKKNINGDESTEESARTASGSADFSEGVPLSDRMALAHAVLKENDEIRNNAQNEKEGDIITTEGNIFALGCSKLLTVRRVSNRLNEGCKDDGVPLTRSFSCETIGDSHLLKGGLGAGDGATLVEGVGGEGMAGSSLSTGGGERVRSQPAVVIDERLLKNEVVRLKMMLASSAARTNSWSANRRTREPCKEKTQTMNGQANTLEEGSI